MTKPTITAAVALLALVVTIGFLGRRSTREEAPNVSPEPTVAVVTVDAEPPAATRPNTRTVRTGATKARDSQPRAPEALTAKAPTAPAAQAPASKTSAPKAATAGSRETQTIVAESHAKFDPRAYVPNVRRREINDEVVAANEMKWIRIPGTPVAIWPVPSDDS